jgi:NitT/TauT family transport system permease protein
MDRFLNPYFAVLLVMPVAPLIPIVIHRPWPRLAARVFIVVSFALVFITINTRAGVRSIEPTLIEMAKSFGRQGNPDLAANYCSPAPCPLSLPA